MGAILDERERRATGFACAVVGVLFCLFTACGSDSPVEEDDDAWIDEFLDVRDTSDTPPDRPDTNTGPDTSVRPWEPPIPPRPPRRDDGQPCREDADCKGDLCLSFAPWIDGYCTRAPCRADSDCYGNARCVLIDDRTACAAACRISTQCRSGYQCAALEDGADGCLPNASPGGRSDGETCAFDLDCRGGTCLFDETWREGYCTSSCTDPQDCHGRVGLPSRCAQTESQGMQCFSVCRADTECRPGYVCRATQLGDSLCAPVVTAPQTSVVPRAPGVPTTLQCGIPVVDGSASVRFTVPDGTTAWTLVPFAADGASVRPLVLTFPDRLAIDVQTSIPFARAEQLRSPSVAPVWLPSAPGLAERVRAGDHTLTVATSSQNLCAYLLAESAPGETIVLDVHVVGAFGWDSEALAEQPGWRAFETAFRALLQPHGLQLVVRPASIDEALARRYSLVRTMEEARTLVASVSAGPVAEDPGLPIFLVDFLLPNDEPRAALAMGQPGAIGLYGTPASGVLVSADLFSSARTPEELRTSARALAHQIGLFAGLMPTSQGRGWGFDVLGDTPECSLSGRCDDVNNWMFPTPASGDTWTMTPEQAGVLRASALTRAAP